MKRVLARACLLPVMLLSGACATMPGPETAPDQAAWRDRQAELMQVVAWDMQGKMSVSQGQQHWNFGFQYKQNQQAYKIELRSVFGHSMHLAGNADKVYIWSSRHAPQVAPTPEQALNNALGIEAPITLLRYWVLGIPSPHVPLTSLQLGRHGEAELIEQAGWRVRYMQRHPETATQSRLPQRIVVERNDIKMVIFIIDWGRMRHFGQRL